MKNTKREQEVYSWDDRERNSEDQEFCTLKREAEESLFHQWNKTESAFEHIERN